MGGGKPPPIPAGACNRPKNFRRILSKFEQLDVTILSQVHFALIVESPRQCEHALGLHPRSADQARQGTRGRILVAEAVDTLAHEVGDRDQQLVVGRLVRKVEDSVAADTTR